MNKNTVGDEGSSSLWICVYKSFKYSRPKNTNELLSANLEAQVIFSKE